MLQVLIDPSMLTARPNKGPCEITINISGCAWPTTAGPIPSFGSKENMMAFFYPWWWERPQKVKLQWFQYQDNGTYKPLDGDVEMDILPYNQPEFDKDRKAIRAHYENLLNSKIVISPDGADPVVINDNEVKYDIANPGGQPREIVVDDDDQTAGRANETGFLNMCVTQLAQRLAPQNLALNLTFFAKADNVTAPAGATHFIAYPFGVAANDRWGKDVTLAPNTDETVRGITYSNGGVAQMYLQTPMTPIPQGDMGNSPIKIRDVDGNFLGHTHVEVYDNDELFHKDIFKQKLIRKTLKIFNLPGLLYEYLADKADDIANIDSTKREAFYKNTNRVFVNLLRDAYAIGSPVNQAVTERILNGITFKEEKDQPDDPALSLGLINKYNAAAKTAGLPTLNSQGFIKDLEDLDKEMLYDKWLLLLNTCDGIKKLIENASVGFTNVDKWDVLNWLCNWEEIIGVNQTPDNSIAAEKASLLKKQIKALPDIFKNESKKDEAEKLFFNIVDDYFQYHDPSGMFMENIVINCKGNTAQSNFHQDEVAGIKSKLINICLKDYIEFRAAIGAGALNPTIKTELDAMEANSSISWAGFEQFVETYNFNNAGHVVSVNIEDKVSDLLRKTTDIPPKVLIKVDTPDDAPSSTYSQEDLSNEIAGHLLLIKRAETLRGEVGTNVDWKALNWTRVNLESKEEKESFPLLNDYFMPGALTEVDDKKETFLNFSNERASIIAGANDSLVEEPKNEKLKKETPEYSFSYLFENRIVVGQETKVYNVPPAYALWYGYNYKFAGCIALNSGVLPQTIRKGDNWSIPQIGKNNIKDSDTALYTHLRRVGIGIPFAETSGSKWKKLQPLPAGLTPLAYELPELYAKKADDNAADKTTLPVCLLSDKDNVILLDVGKPRTDYQNWYAWKAPLISKQELQEVLTRDLEVRGKKDQQNEYLHDPAVLNTLLIRVVQIFPELQDEKVETFVLKLANENENIAQPAINKKINIKLGARTDTADKVRFIKPDGSIEVPPGYVIKLSVHCLTNKKYYDEKEGRFHSWMGAVVDSKVTDALFNDYYITHPTEIIFEAAIAPPSEVKGEKVDDKKMLSAQLWEDLLPDQYEKQQVILDIKKSKYEYSYFNRTRVYHQVWHWNGRLAGNLLKYFDEEQNALPQDKRKNFPGDINPAGITNYAMKWEAWEFSDRPDFSVLEHETYLKATRTPDNLPATKQTLFTDNRPVDDKALYYRFTAEIFGRYELLGGIYAGSVKAAIDVDKVPNPWRRFIKLSNKVFDTLLPKPVIRFVIPLTASIDECSPVNEISSASLMIVTNDRWFSELGLAEKFELGIDLLKHEGAVKKQEYYLNAGGDPILSPDGLQGIDLGGITSVELPETDTGNTSVYQNDNPVAVFSPEGPAGLTFDFATATPKLLGSTFILKVKDINRFLPKNADPKMGPWSMVQIAARRTVYPQFLKSSANSKVPKSKWTAKEWVQFLPDTNSFIPAEWRREHANYGFVGFKITGEKSIAAVNEFKMPVLKADFDRADQQIQYEPRTEKYLIVSQRVQNAGGLPAELYQATYHYQEGKGFVLNDAAGANFSNSALEGFARLIIVRVSKKLDNDSKNLWEMLFGENVHRTVPFGQVQNDATAALPLITKRFSITIKK